MRTIKNGVADEDGKRYLLNIEIASLNDGYSTHDNIERDHREEEWQKRISDSRIARKGKFY
ncbi:MAG: hypothetical protein AAB497_03270 [Patescibacteria group bacterium]